MKSPQAQLLGVIACISSLLLLSGCDKQDYGDEEILRLKIPAKSGEKLQLWASQALKQGVITNDLKQYVDAQVIIDTIQYDAKIRLKGDWTDHLETDRWSFRIKILGEGRYKELRTFSIMAPQTRNFLDEWFLHKVMEDQNVMTTRFDYTPVEINGEDMGVFAIEEHFTEDLIVNELRTLGPILKIAEDGIWEVIARGKETGKNILDSLPIFEASIIEPFGKKKVLKSQFLYNSFCRGQNLLYAYKSGIAEPDAILKIDPLARLYAVGDLGKILHGYDAHNQRWHYDFSSDKLEAIAYDLAGNHRLRDNERKPLYGLKSDHTLDINKRKDIIPYLPYNSDQFVAVYLNTLKEISRESYLDSLFISWEDEINRCEELIQINDPDYSFDTQFYYDNAIRISKEIRKFTVQSEWPAPRFNLGPWVDYADSTIAEPFPHVSINAYWDRSDSLLYLENFYADPIAIVSYTSDNQSYPIDTLTLYSFNSSSRPVATIKFPEVDELNFITSIQGAEYHVPVHPWPHPTVLINPNP